MSQSQEHIQQSQMLQTSITLILKISDQMVDWTDAQDLMQLARSMAERMQSLKLQDPLLILSIIEMAIEGLTNAINTYYKMIRNDCTYAYEYGKVLINAGINDPDLIYDIQCCCDRLNEYDVMPILEPHVTQENYVTHLENMVNTEDEISNMRSIFRDLATMDAYKMNNKLSRKLSTTGLLAQGV